MRSQQLYAGFDGGGTRTTCVISASDGSVMGTGSAGPSNYHNVGLDNALDALRTAFGMALAKASIGKSKIEAACFGLAGLDSRRDMETINRAVSLLELSPDNLVVNDWRITLSGAFIGEPGIILIAGTGCVAAGQNTRSEIVRVGGWGNIIDDKGSAYDIGRDALHAAMRSYDGRGPETRLLGMLMKKLKVDEPQDLIEKVHLHGMGVADIASLCTVVGRAALDGDAVSLSILKEKAKILGELAITVAARLGVSADPFKVSLSGGVFAIGRPILAPLTATIRASAPRARLTASALTPTCGAIILLLQRRGLSVDRGVVTRLRSSLETAS